MPLVGCRTLIDVWFNLPLWRNSVYLTRQRFMCVSAFSSVHIRRHRGSSCAGDGGWPGLDHQNGASRSIHGAHGVTCLQQVLFTNHKHNPPLPVFVFHFIVLPWCFPFPVSFICFSFYTSFHCFSLSVSSSFLLTCISFLFLLFSFPFFCFLSPPSFLHFHS